MKKKCVKLLLCTFFFAELSAMDEGQLSLNIDGDHESDVTDSTARSFAPCGEGTDFSRLENEMTADFVEPHVVSRVADCPVEDSGRWVKVKKLRGHRSLIFALAFNVHGSLLASGSGDSTIRLWHAKSDALCACLDGHESDVVTLAFSPDESYLASGSWDTKCCLWDGVAGRKLHEYSGPQGVAKRVMWLDRATIISGSWNGVVNLLDTRSHERQRLIPNVGSAIDGLAVVDNQLVVGQSVGGVSLWDLRTLKREGCFSTDKYPLCSLAMSADGKKLAAGLLFGGIMMWDLEAKKRIFAARKHMDAVSSMDFSPDGGTLLTGSLDGKMWALSLDGITRSKILRNEDQDAIFAVAMSPAGKQFAAGAQDRTVRMWEKRPAA